MYAKPQMALYICITFYHGQERQGNVASFEISGTDFHNQLLTCSECNVTCRWAQIKMRSVYVSTLIWVSNVPGVSGSHISRPKWPPNKRTELCYDGFLELVNSDIEINALKRRKKKVISFITFLL